MNLLVTEFQSQQPRTVSRDYFPDLPPFLQQCPLIKSLCVTVKFLNEGGWELITAHSYRGGNNSGSTDDCPSLPSGHQQNSDSTCILKAGSGLSPRKTSAGHHSLSGFKGSWSVSPP